MGIEKLVDTLLIFMNDEIEKVGCSICYFHFDFTEEGKDLSDFCAQHDESVKDIQTAINRCISRKDLAYHSFEGRQYSGMRLTAKGHCRALSAKSGKPRTNDESSSVMNIGTLNVQGSAQVGNNNQQNINTTYNEILEQIEKTSSSDEEKAEAKSLLNRFFNHPVILAAISGAAGGISSKIAS